MDKRKDNEILIWKAKLAEQTERYDDMAKFMKEFIEKVGELNSEERNLFSVAYKNVVGPMRSACRILSNMECKDGADMVATAKEYRAVVVKELKDTCEEVLVSVSFSFSLSALLFISIIFNVLKLLIHSAL